jgi:hypothetical protein
VEFVELVGPPRVLEGGLRVEEIQARLHRQIDALDVRRLIDDAIILVARLTEARVARDCLLHGDSGEAVVRVRGGVRIEEVDDAPRVRAVAGFPIQQRPQGRHSLLPGCIAGRKGGRIDQCGDFGTRALIQSLQALVPGRREAAPIAVPVREIEKVAARVRDLVSGDGVSVHLHTLRRGRLDPSPRPELG